MTDILVICGDQVDSHMGGVGVRSWEIARSLSQYFGVTLAVPNRTELSASNLKLVSYDLQKGDLKALAEQMDVILLNGSILHFHPYLRDLGIPLVVDLYIPWLLENLVWHDPEDWNTWIPAYEEYSRVQGDLIRAGDFFICASERQRDYWLGWLHAQKRINPHTYRQDPTLRKLLDVVPFGLPDGRPDASKPVLKNVKPGIFQADKLVIWSGGLWDWLDPLTLIRAMALLEKPHPEFKLYFLGTHHPNPLVSGMKMPQLAMELSQELGLLNRTIFFGDWVPYEQRGSYLAEADLSVISHQAHIETHFSFRTRVLDCIWAGLPLIVTEGDAMSEIVSANRIGLTVPPGNAEALAGAIERLLTEINPDDFSQTFEGLRQEYSWDKVIQPLRNFCENPAAAPDKGRYLTEVERISIDKDRFLEQVIHDKDEYWQGFIKDREALIERYQRSLPLRIYHWLKSVLGK